MQPHWLLFVSLLLLSWTKTGAEDAHPRIQPRVYGGEPISNGELGGFGVQIFYITTLVCTGTLLSPRHLITAAHCFENMIQSNFHVVAGKTPEFDATTHFRKNGLVEVRVHPNFQKLQFIADIAVAKTQFPLKSSRIGYAKICASPLFPVDTVTVAGWGESGARSGTRNTLRIMRVPIVDHKACEKKLERTLPPNILCASAYDHRTLCTGDSGGPLLFRDEVCGVNTWTWKCGDDQKPNVFMSVRHYANFIKSTIKEMGY